MSGKIKGYPYIVAAELDGDKVVSVETEPPPEKYLVHAARHDAMHTAAYVRITGRGVHVGRQVMDLPPAVRRAIARRLKPATFKVSRRKHPHEPHWWTRQPYTDAITGEAASDP